VLLLLLLLLGNARTARAEGCEARPCAHAENLWWAPGDTRFVSLAGARPAPLLGASAGVALAARFRPAILSVPSPAAEGREVNVIRDAVDSTLWGSLGLPYAFELWAAVPFALWQRGAGLEGVTTQSSEPISASALHDPRLGVAYGQSLAQQRLALKARLEAKLPLGSESTLAGERSFVLSPSLLAAFQFDGWFSAAEIGLRLRPTTEIYGARIGSQASITLGAGYGLSPRYLGAFAALETILLPSLVASGSVSHFAGEWLGSVGLAPSPALTFSLGAGTGLPLSSNSRDEPRAAFGVPSTRLFAQFRFTPDD
jgi:hypothetical protein